MLGSGQYPNVELGVAPMPGPSTKGGVLVSGGELFMVNKSAPAKQAAAWEYLKFLDSARQPDHLGHRHRLPADPQDGGEQRADADLLGREPDLQGGV